jgi:glycosyltransferase involved in cell wall biosynthesis
MSGVAAVKTTLIIASYNQPRSLPLVLESVAGQFQPVDEIIIADDGSKQPVLDVIDRCRARFSLPIKAILTQKDCGFRKSVALNRAILQSTGQQLLFLDGDVVVPPYWSLRHMRSYRPMGYSTGAYLRLTVEQSRNIAGRGLNELRWSDYLSRSHFSLSHFKTNYRVFRRYLKDLRGIAFGDCRRPEMWGGNFSVDRGLLFGVNGFDEQFVGFSGVDWDLRNRMNNYGAQPTSLTFGTLALHLHHGLESDEPHPQAVKNRRPIDQSPYHSSTDRVWAVTGLAERWSAAQDTSSGAQETRTLRSTPVVSPSPPTPRPAA